MVPAGNGGGETFGDFVARSVDGLTRLSYLLCGDPDRAARLVRSCLVRVRGTWPSGSPVRVLVGDWLAAPGHYEPALGAEPRREAFRHALGALPPRQRAAVVLRSWAGLPVAEVAEVLGCPERTVLAETAEGLDAVHAAAAELTGSTASALGLVAADVRPVPVTLDDIDRQVLAQRRHRRRSVAVAAGVLVLAGGFATTLGVGATESDAGPDRIVVTRAPPEVAAPVMPDPGPVVVDDQARRLTAQLAAARERVLPGVEDLRAGPAGPLTGGTRRAPLEFFTRTSTQPLGTYFAQAAFGADGRDALLVLEIRKRPVAEVAGYAPCPEFEQDCTFRQFPDGTRADVVVYTDPASRRVVHSLSSLRPDGTYFHVTVFGVGDATGPPPLSVEDLFRFATVLTF